MGFKFSSRSLVRMEGVHPDLQRIAQESILISPIDFGIPGDGGVRTAQRQHELFIDPKVQTNADGYTITSNHQPKADGYGHALDVYAYINGKASWQLHHLSMVAATFMITAQMLYEHGEISHLLKWGGTFGSDDFSGWDFVHYELIGGHHG